MLAVTVVQLGPCTVTQIKTEPTDGYEAVQVTFGKKKLSRVSSAARGHFAKSEIAPGVKTTEFEKRGEGELKLGQPIAIADVFKIGDTVDVSATSKGHGYQGVMKRHHFKRDIRPRAEPTNISATAARSVTAPIPAACAKGCGWRGRWATRRRPC